MKLLSFGEILWDIYPEEQFIGGAPLNFAAHCARHGQQVYMLSAVGTEALGDTSLEKVKSWGIRTDFVSRLADKETGKCIVTLDENSVPSYNLLTDVAWDYIDCRQVAEETFDVLYFGTLALRSKENMESMQALLARKPAGEVFVDINIRPPFYTDSTIRFALENATIAKISDEELPTVAAALGIACEDDHEANARQLCQLFPQLRLLIITLGKDGSCAYDAPTGHFYRQAPVLTEVKSTVGAGDSFGAAFLAKYLNGTPIDQSLSYAAKVAAFVVSQFGAIPDYQPEDLE